MTQLEIYDAWLGEKHGEHCVCVCVWCLSDMFNIIKTSTANQNRAMTKFSTFESQKLSSTEKKSLFNLTRRHSSLIDIKQLKPQ